MTFISKTISQIIENNKTIWKNSSIISSNNIQDINGRIIKLFYTSSSINNNNDNKSYTSTSNSISSADNNDTNNTQSNITNENITTTIEESKPTTTKKSRGKKSQDTETTNNAKNNNTESINILNSEDNKPARRGPGRPRKVKSETNITNTDNNNNNTISSDTDKITINIKDHKSSSKSYAKNDFRIILEKVITEPEGIDHNIKKPIKDSVITENSIMDLEKLLAEIENTAVNNNTKNKENNTDDKIKINKSKKLIKHGKNIESNIPSISSSNNNNKFYDINKIYSNNNTLDYYIDNTISILPNNINFNNLYNIIVNSLSKTINNVTNINNENITISNNNNNINNNYVKPKIYQSHGWHLVTPSPWPVQSSYILILLPISTVIYFNGYKVPFINSSIILVIINIILTIFIIFLWFRDIIIEGTYIGNHTILVQSSLIIGIILFILSEVIFFFSIFWAYFHSSLSPAVEIGTQWPPIGIITINAFELPLLNTILLLSSAATVTYSHHSLINKQIKPAINALLITLGLAIVFTICQSIEYYNAGFTFSDGVYGSTFYIATGFHGLHVIIGTIFLAVSLFRIFYQQITNTHHIGYEAGIIYYHFVDIVWLGLFVIIYWWGSLLIKI